MTAVSDERFEPPIGFQTSGGPVWKTEITQLASGAEIRNAKWASPLRKWQVSGVPLTAKDGEVLTRFFNARSGAHQAFRFQDPFGWKTAETVTPLDQYIGTGDGDTTVFQLIRDDGTATGRLVTRPVAASLRVAVDGTETMAFTVDETTGEVTFETAPASGAVISAGFEFDVLARFETDTLELSKPAMGALQLVRLSLVEVREA